MWKRTLQNCGLSLMNYTNVSLISVVVLWSCPEYDEGENSQRQKADWIYMIGGKSVQKEKKGFRPTPAIRNWCLSILEEDEDRGGPRICK